MDPYVEHLRKIRLETERKEKFQANMLCLERRGASYFNLLPLTLIGKKRTKDLALQRQIVFYAAKALWNYYFSEIGEWFQRDHTTAIYAYHKIKKQIEKDPVLAETVTTFLEQIKQDIKSRPKKRLFGFGYYPDDEEDENEQQSQLQIT